MVKKGGWKQSGYYAVEILGSAALRKRFWSEIDDVVW